MNTNMNELTMDQMDMVNGGFDLIGCIKTRTSCCRVLSSACHPTPGLRIYRCHEQTSSEETETKPKGQKERN